MLYRCKCCLLLPLVLVLVQLSAALGIERLLVNLDGREQKFVGEAVLEDPAGGLLLKTDEGALWPINAKAILDRTTDAAELAPLSKKQLAERLLQEMGPAFKSHESKPLRDLVQFALRAFAKGLSGILEKGGS